MSQLQQNMSSLLNNLMFLFCELFDSVRLSKLSDFKRFIANHDFNMVEILTNIKALVVDWTVLI